jgi:hypothetical protein
VRREPDEIPSMVVFAIILAVAHNHQGIGVVTKTILILGAIYCFGFQRSKPAETVVIPEAETATP